MTFNWQLPHSVTHTFSTFNPIPNVPCAKALGNVLTTRLSTVNKARRVLFYLKRSLAALTLCTMFYLATNGVRYSSTPSHPIPRRRGIGKGAETPSEVRERPLAYLVWSSSPMASFILFYQSVDPCSRPHVAFWNTLWSPSSLILPAQRSWLRQ